MELLEHLEANHPDFRLDRHLKAKWDQWEPASQAEKDSVRKQLDRILAHHVFKNTVRCTKLLSYIVEYSLDGAGAPLKERTLGIEVFGRDPDYDSVLDPIVRATASDIRRRIAQYYHEPDHESEIRIDLPAGSYLAAFHLPVDAPETDSADPISEVSPAPPVPIASPALGIRRLVLVASLATIVALAAAWGWSRLASRTSLPTTGTTADYAEGGEPAINVFWRPILAQSAQVLLCAGKPKNDNTGLGFADEAGVARVADFLIQNGKTFLLKTSVSATSNDIQQSTAILVGGFVNSWSVHATEPLRFHFAGNPGVGTVWIEDRKNPSLRDWSHPPGTEPSSSYQKDYGVVARFKDSQTGQWVLVAAGLDGYSNSAAVELLTDGRYFDEIVKHAPAEWTRMNIEAVFVTQVTDGELSPPQVVAVELW
jgi:hypothetical protein